MGDAPDGFKLKFPKPKPYTYGENFRRFTDRFKEWCTVTGAKGDQLPLYLLSLVDSRTYDTLKSVTLSQTNKENVEDFCQIYHDIMAPKNEIRGYRSQLISLKQEESEDIDDYVYRLRELAIKAYDDPAMREPILFTSFLENVYDQGMRVKLHESSAETFNDAIYLARRIQNANAGLRKALQGDLCEVDTDGSSSHHKQTPAVDTGPTTKQGVQCQLCNKIGHIAPNCWGLGRARNFNSFPGRRNSTNTRGPSRWATNSQRNRNTDIVCWHCNGPHVRANCELYNRDLNSRRGGANLGSRIPPQHTPNTEPTA